VAFNIPSIPDLGSRIRNAFRAYLPGTDAFIEPNNLSIAGKTFTLVMFEAYQRLGFLYKQMFASTADGDHLEFRHAADYGIVRKPATAASGLVTLTQVTPGAQTVAAGLVLVRDDGTLYATLDSAVMSAGTASVAVRAQIGGAATNAPAGSSLTIDQTSGVPNLLDVAIVGTGGLGGGADAEADEELRARVLLRKQAPPRGGNAADYIRWALDVPGCTRAFVSPFVPNVDGVTVFPLFDDTRVNGIPKSEDLDAVLAYIEPLRPITADVFVAAATPYPIDVGVSGLVPDNARVRGAIQATLNAIIRDRCPLSTAADPFVLPRAWIDEAVSRATGEQRHTLTAPLTDLTIPAGNLPVPGALTFS